MTRRVTLFLRMSNHLENLHYIGQCFNIESISRFRQHNRNQRTHSGPRSSFPMCLPNEGPMPSRYYRIATPVARIQILSVSPYFQMTSRNAIIMDMTSTISSRTATGKRAESWPAFICFLWLLSGQVLPWRVYGSSTRRPCCAVGRELARPSVYNCKSFPAMRSFQSWHHIWHSDR